MVNIIKTIRPVYCLLHKPSQVVRVWCLLISGLFYLTAAINKASAATYYLDAVNGNDSNPGTSESPLKSLQSVFEDGKIQRRTTPTGSITNPTAPVAPGDTIRLRTGYHDVINGYTGWHNNEGPIIIEADTGHHARWPVYYLSCEFVSFSHFIFVKLISPLLTIKESTVSKSRHAWVRTIGRFADGGFIL